MPLTESQRNPLLDDASRARLRAWREHPRAPLWNTLCGDRLRAGDLESVRLFARECDSAPSWSSFSEPPLWAREFARKYLQAVPFYRNRGGSADDWLSIPPCDRLDLGREPWHFVPDGLGLEPMVAYNTSGTTGSEAWIPAHWRWPSTYLPLYERALKLNGADWESARRAWPERAAIVSIAAQEHTLAFAAWSSYLGGANLKINLHPAQWRAPSDCLEFLHEANPLLICGDPVSLGALAASGFVGAPVAIISSAIALPESQRAELQNRFGCPVVDIYSTNESGPVASSAPTSPSSTCSAMPILAPDVWLEILRPDGSPCDEGELGEITFTGGRNPFMPLLRYRSGDFARGQVLDGTPHLADFHGRALVKFLVQFDSGEREILDIDVTHALKNLPLREFSLRQGADSSLEFRFRGLAEPRDIEAALRKVFPRNALRIESLAGWSEGSRKLIRYSRES